MLDEIKQGRFQFVETVAIAIEGKALAWFQFVEDRLKFRCWDDFKEALLIRFPSRQEGTPCQKFLAVKQETTVEDYLEKYEGGGIHTYVTSQMQ